MRNILVSIAAIIVIAAGGYFFWGEYRKAGMEACQSNLIPWQQAKMSGTGLDQIERRIADCLDQGLITDTFLMQFGMTTDNLRAGLKTRRQGGATDPGPVDIFDPIDGE